MKTHKRSLCLFVPDSSLKSLICGKVSHLYYKLNMLKIIYKTGKTNCNNYFLYILIYITMTLIPCLCVFVIKVVYPPDVVEGSKWVEFTATGILAKLDKS